MSVDAEPEDNEPRSVRVELFDTGGTLVQDVGAPIVADRDQSRWPVVAMVLAAGALVGGLWWAAGIEPSSTPEPERPALVDRFEGDAPTGGDTERTEMTDEQLPLRLSQSTTWIPLDADLAHVVQGPDGVLAAGDWVSEAPGVEDRQPVLTRLSYVNVWTFGTVQNIPRGARIVGLSRIEDEILVFASTTDPAGGGSELTIYSSPGGTDEVWRERNRFPVQGHIRSLSSRDGRWVATIDERAQATTAAQPMRTTLLTGTVDGSIVSSTSVAPDEFVSSFAAIEEGFIAIVVRLQLQALVDDGPTPELRQWTVDDGWTHLGEDMVSRPTQAPARIIDAGENGIYWAFGTELSVATGFPLVWKVIASGQTVTGALDEPSAPETTPARVGPGYMVVDTTVGDVQAIWISTDGVLWRQQRMDMAVRNLELLEIVDGLALVAGISDATPGVMRIDLTAPASQSSSTLELDVRERTVADGEWTTPVFTAADLDGSGFVGLTSSNGEIVLVESDNGFDVDRQTPTDFPFGYFANDMHTTTLGYHVVGQLGLIEDAVFTSLDGISWERFPFVRPRDATALQIDHFHRSAHGAALAGSLGWADDLSRTERVVLWWDESGTVYEVPARPCGSATTTCSITSITTVAGGILATHGRDQNVSVSKWNQHDGWVDIPVSARPELDPSPLDDGLFFDTWGESAWFLSTERTARSGNGGETWTFGIQAPYGEVGRFTAVSGSGLSAVFETATDLWFRSSGSWTQFGLGDVIVGNVLAITDEAAILSGTGPNGSLVIRLSARPGDR